jgi:mannose-6-phosphate isomerase-like protein (cupin superfamily)
MNQMPENLFDYALSEEAALRPERPRELFDHWQPHILVERAAYLRKLARAGEGSASETLREYPQHAVMLSVRSRSGEAEVHEKFADLFYVLSGEATLVTGGTVVKARTEAPGETRGERIEGGVRRLLRPGEVAHVPAGLAHQTILAGDKTLTCFVVKIQEQP